MKILVTGDPFSIAKYSMVCRDTVLGLLQEKHNVSVLLKISDKERYQNFSGAALIKEVVNKRNDAKVSLQITSPDQYDNSLCDHNIGVLYYESSQLPKHWVEACNGMSGIIVPSKFVEQICKVSGVTVPVHVANGYVAKPIFEVNDWRKSLDIPADHKIIVAVLQWTYRKGWDILFKAYWSAFSSEDKVTLVVKTYGRDTGVESQNRILEDINRLKGGFVIIEPNGKQSIPELPQTRMIFSKLSDEGLASLYDAADLVVVPSRGESWPRIALEAMSHGKKVVGADWGGASEVMSRANSYPIRYDIAPCMGVNGYIYPISSFFCEPSIFNMSQMMCHVVMENEDSHAQDIVATAVETADHFNLKKSVEEHIAAINQIVNPVKAEVVNVG